MPHLKNLSLSTNRIENIQQDAFIKLTSLQELILRSNYLKHFSFGTGFGAIPELVKLDISNNLIQIIDKVSLISNHDKTNYKFGMCDRKS